MISPSDKDEWITQSATELATSTYPIFSSVLFSLANWSPYILRLLSLRVVGVARVGNYVRSSFSHWALGVLGFDDL